MWVLIMTFLKLIVGKFICCKDPTYQSILLHMFANRLIRNGKKFVAYRILYSILHEIRLEIRGLPVAIMEHAVRIIIPPVQLKALRISGAVYQVPVDIQLNVSISIAIKWILNASAHCASKQVACGQTRERERERERETRLRSS